MPIDTSHGTLMVLINVALTYSLFYPQFYSFRGRLRLTLSQMILLYAGLTVLLLAGCAMAMNYWSFDFRAAQIYKWAFAPIFVITPYFIVKDSAAKISFNLLVTACYTAATIRVSNFIEMRYGGAYIEAYYFFVNNVIMAVLMAVSLPLIFLFAKKVLVPALTTLDDDIWKFIWLIPALYFVVCTIRTVDFQPEGIMHWRSPLSSLILVAGMVISCFVLLKSLSQAKKITELAENVRLVESVIARQERQYQLISDSMDSIVQTRHDWKHHLSVIQRFAEQHDSGGLQKYLADYTAALPKDLTHRYCGNAIVNAVLSYYLSMAEGLSVKADISVDLPSRSGISDVDLCVVFGNCLENAVEACGKIPREERFIQLKCQQIKRYIVIVVDNSFNGEVTQDGDTFLSGKPNGGVGLASVRSIAGKYHGEAKFEAAGTVFRSSVMLRMGDGERIG